MSEIIGGEYDRVNLFGTTHMLKDAQARQDTALIKDAIGELSNGVETIIPQIFDHSQVDKDTGEIEATENAVARTDFIPVYGGETVWVYNSYASSRNVFYDANKNYIDDFNIPVGQPAYISVPQNAAYMICCNSNVAGRMYTAFYRVARFIDSTLTQSGKAADAKATGDRLTELSGDVDEARAETAALAGSIGGIAEDVSNVENAVTNLYQGIETILPTIIPNSTINTSTGVIEESTDPPRARTDYIPVYAGETIWVNNTYASSRNAFYDANQNFLSSFQISIGQPASFQVPDNAAYMICSNSSVAGRMYTAFYRVARFIDKTLTQSGKAAEAKETGDRLLLLSGSVAEAKAAAEELLIDIGAVSTDIPQTVTKSAGYMGTDGVVGGASGGTYFHTSQIPVQEGDVVLAQNGSGSAINTRFVCAFVNGVANASLGRSTQTAAGYTVPAGVTSVVVTCYAAVQASAVFIVRRTVAETDIRHNKNKWSLSAEASSLAENALLGIPNSSALYNKKNCSYSFWANISTFSGLKIGHGTTSLGGSYIEITPTQIIAYQGNGSSTATEVGRFDLPQDFAFSEFVSVNIHVGYLSAETPVNNLQYLSIPATTHAGAETALTLGNPAVPTATVTILSGNKRFIQEGVPFVGCRGQVFAQPAAAMTNAVLSYSMRDLKSDVFIFGDSYTSLNDQNRWPFHVMQAGYSDFMLCGYPGAGSQDILTALQQMIALARPKYIVWLLGMNNPDTETGYNENWKTALDSVLEICENIKATPILATIPNTPTVSNYYKNQYVREESGCRYIDFAKAVGAEALNAPWYTGMLSTDNVHPTVYGARALAMRLLADLPEIT